MVTKILRPGEFVRTSIDRTYLRKSPQIKESVEDGICESIALLRSWALLPIFALVGQASCEPDLWWNPCRSFGPELSLDQALPWVERFGDGIRVSDLHGAENGRTRT